MKPILYAFSIILILTTCQKDPAEPVIPVKVIVEEPIVPASNVPVFFHGDTSEGAATAIKIDKKWKARAASWVVKDKGIWLRSIAFSTHINDSRFIRELLLLQISLMIVLESLLS